VRCRTAASAGFIDWAPTKPEQRAAAPRAPHQSAPAAGREGACAPRRARLGQAECHVRKKQPRRCCGRHRIIWRPRPRSCLAPRDSLRPDTARRAIAAAAGRHTINSARRARSVPVQADSSRPLNSRDRMTTLNRGTPSLSCRPRSAESAAAPGNGRSFVWLASSTIQRAETPSCDRGSEWTTATDRIGWG